ncbi:MAG: murein L,D-transpeptidase [Chloroflexi bacterium]|nr:MAG: murein L,D-transpeptidase [Chloroflexota bacterium]
MHVKSVSENPLSSYNRRDFLKLSGAGLAAWLLSPIVNAVSQGHLTLGRILEQNVRLYQSPDFGSKVTGVYWKDDIVNITSATVGGDEPAHNRVWYKIEEKGYVHSGVVQPVLTQLNEPVVELPEVGALAEVTVPFTDALWGPGKTNRFAYRYYYETTYWIDGLVYDSNGEPWYRIQEDKWDLILYTPAEHLRVILPEELTPISPEIPLEAKRLEVQTANQLVLAYEYDKPVFAARAATGAIFSNGRYLTPAGRHQTFHKRPSRHMAAGNLTANGYDLPGVPWVTYFTKSGIAIHGTYWHNDYGKPRSHGCVNVNSQAAKWIYLWTLPYVPYTEQRVYENFGTTLDVI